MATAAAWERTVRRGVVALAMAYALVAQLVFAGAAMALAAGTAHDGDFRTLFCRPSAGTGPGGAGRTDAPTHSSLPGCCLAGCGMLGALAAAPPAGGLEAPARPFARIARIAPREMEPRPAARRAAHLARAPPQTARDA